MGRTNLFCVYKKINICINVTLSNLEHFISVVYSFSKSKRQKGKILSIHSEIMQSPTEISTF